MKKSEQVFRTLYSAMLDACRANIPLGTHDIGTFTAGEIYVFPVAHAKCCAIGCYLIGKRSTDNWIKDAASELGISQEEVALITRGFDLGPSEISKDEYFQVGARLRSAFSVL